MEETPEKSATVGLKQFTSRHSFKLMLGLVLCLIALSLSLMSSHWLSQIAKYNQLRAKGAFPAALSAPPSAQMLAQGKQLYDANCIGCHGKDAGGQEAAKALGGTYSDGVYYAPALNATGHTAVHTTSALFFVAKYGSLTRADSAMQGWEGRLSDEQLVSIMQWMRSTWPAPLRDAQGKYPTTWFP